MAPRRALAGAAAALAAACCAALLLAPAAPALAFFTVQESPSPPPPPPPSPPFTSVLDVAQADPDFTLLVQAIVDATKGAGDLGDTLDLQVRDTGERRLLLVHARTPEAARFARGLLDRREVCSRSSGHAPEDAHVRRRARAPRRPRVCHPPKALLLSACP